MTPATDFQDAGTEFVPEELQRCLGFQAAFDAVEGQRRDALGQLRFGDARLNAQRLDQDMPWPADWLRHVVEPHVVEAVETPCFHRWIL